MLFCSPTFCRFRQDWWHTGTLPGAWKKKDMNTADLSKILLPPWECSRQKHLGLRIPALIVNLRVPELKPPLAIYTIYLLFNRKSFALRWIIIVEFRALLTKHTIYWMNADREGAWAYQFFTLRICCLNIFQLGKF